MAKATPDYEAIGKAVVLLASLFGGGAAVPQAAAASAKTDPTPSTTASPETPAPPKAEEPKAASGNSKGLSAANFAKINVGYAGFCKDNGAALKALWAELGLKDADGKPVERSSTIQEADYDRVVEAIEAAKLA